MIGTSEGTALPERQAATERVARRSTIRDVAESAGVSVGTASKALNGQGKLRAETRERVAEVAQRLGFAPNTLAQALLDRKSTRLNSSH